MARDRDSLDHLPGAQRKLGTGRPFHRASKTARAAVTRVAGDAGFAEADVLLRWTEIVGADMVPRCRPVKVSYGGRARLGATLVVQASSGRAPEIAHLEPAILERINQFYGYRAISRIKITQSEVARGFAEGQAPFDGPGAKTSPTQADAHQADRMTDGIQTPGLRAALKTMGAHVLARARNRHNSDPET